jgi:hypothetical protein
VDMHVTDLVGINGITRVLLLYTCQQGVYPRGHVLPLRIPLDTGMKPPSSKISNDVLCMQDDPL